MLHPRAAQQIDLVSATLVAILCSASGYVALGLVRSCGVLLEVAMPHICAAKLLITITGQL